MKVRTISLLCLASTMAWAALAQGATGGPDRFGYGWADSDETDVTYEWLDVGTGATCVSLNDDQESAAIPIGFTFNFYGTDYTDLRIGSNGYVTFQANTLRGFGGQCPLPMDMDGSSETVNLAVYGFFQDLNPLETTSGDLCYATLGTAPDRTFVVSWNAIDYYLGDDWESDPVTFQIVLYETSNEIQINIQDAGTNAGLPRWITDSDRTVIGIENGDGLMGLSLCDWSEATRIPDAYSVRFRASDSFGILPGRQDGISAAGATTTYDLELLNFGDAAVTADLSASGSTGWTATPSLRSVTAAADGGSAAFTVDVTAPTGAAAGDVGTITVTGTAGTETTRATIRVAVTHGDSDWQPIAELPEAMQYVTLIGEGGFLYSITGESLDTSVDPATRLLLSKVYRWDPIVNGWDDCAVADLPTPVTLGSACAMNGHIYYVGGLTQLADAGPPETPAFFLEPLLDYDIAADTWTERTPPPYAVISANVACDPGSGKVYVYGGVVDVNQNLEAEIQGTGAEDDPDTTVPLFQAYDVADDSWEDTESGSPLVLQNEDNGLSDAAVGLLDGAIYMAAGSYYDVDDTTGEFQSWYSSTVHMYDIADNSWSYATALPTMASNRMGFVYQGQFCTIGGIDSSSTAETLVAVADWWCLADDGWVLQSDPLPEVQMYYGVAVVEDFVYLAGGRGETPDLIATAQRWPTDTDLPAAIDPVICAADADADGDADTDGGEDTAADADADTGADADADTAGDTTADTTPDGGSDDGDDGCGCRVTHAGGAGSFLTLLLALGAAFIARRRRG